MYRNLCEYAFFFSGSDESLKVLFLTHKHCNKRSIIHDCDDNFNWISVSGISIGSFTIPVIFGPIFCTRIRLIYFCIYRNSCISERLFEMACVEVREISRGSFMTFVVVGQSFCTVNQRKQSLEPDYPSSWALELLRYKGSVCEGTS